MTPDWIKQASSNLWFRTSAATADIEAALLSVASRVERETIERCKDVAQRATDGDENGAFYISDLPLQYKET